MKLFKLIVVITVIAAACTKEEDHTSLNSEDKYFAQNISYFHLAEITEGGIAITNSNSDTVKTFAHATITDYTMAQTELDSVAGLLNVQLPITLDSAHLAMATHLQSLYGNVFDTTYIGAQVTDHMNALAIFNSEIALGNNEQLLDYAHKYLPLIQMHLQEAQTIQALLH